MRAKFTAAAIRDAEQRQQARKSAQSAARNVAEAAGRWSRADKARVYAIARGEVCEACAAVEIAEAIGCASGEDVERVNALGKRLCDMLGRPAWGRGTAPVAGVGLGSGSGFGLGDGSGFGVGLGSGGGFGEPQRGAGRRWRGEGKNT